MRAARRDRYNRATLIAEGCKAPEFLRMIVVHELAHLRQGEHDKAFYQLCRHMEADYHQFEFDLRAYLCHLEATGRPLWSAATIVTAETG